MRSSQVDCFPCVAKERNEGDLRSTHRREGSLRTLRVHKTKAYRTARRQRVFSYRDFPEPRMSSPAYVQWIGMIWYPRSPTVIEERKDAVPFFPAPGQDGGIYRIAKRIKCLNNRRADAEVRGAEQPWSLTAQIP